jgi:hypothetical protein
MFAKAGRICAAVALTFAAFTAISHAQTVHTPEIKHHPLTPAERTLMPLLQKLKASAAGARADGKIGANDTGSYVTAPNFGGFVSAPFYPARTSASTVLDTSNNGVAAEVTGDFNLDGHPDVAVVQNDGTMNVLLNTGTGALAAPVSYSNPNVLSSSIPQAFAADVNGDGSSDIVAFDTNNNTVLVWLNDGSGTFKTVQTTPPLNSDCGYIVGIAVGDANHDGKSDIVAACSNLLSRTSATMTLQTLLSNGDGTFKAAIVKTVPVASNLSLSGNAPIALGDFNGDGKLDVAAVFLERTGQSTGNVVVTTALGNGDGTFGSLGANGPISFTVTSTGNFNFNTSGITVADLNGDGKQDLALDMNGLLYTALGQGDGTFLPSVSTSFPNSGNGTIFVDLNGDGYLDAIAANYAFGIFLGKGDGTFAQPAAGAQYIVDFPLNQGIVAADFDGDHSIDLAVLGGEYKAVSMYFGNGKGLLRGAPVLTAPSDSNPLDYYLEGVLKSTTSGFSDVLALQLESTANQLVTGVSDGKGNFTYVQSLAAGITADFAFVQPVQVDFNGDGKQDLLYSTISGGLSVALANGNGTFATPVPIKMPTLSCPVYYGAAGDVNGDGKLDIVAAYPGDAPCDPNGSTPSGYFVISGNGDGTFGTPAFYPSGGELYSVTLADLNLDGRLDLITDDLEPNSTFPVTLLPGNGDGTYGSPITLLSNYIVTDVKVADLNGDGNPDVLLSAQGLLETGYSNGGLILFSGNGDLTFGDQRQIATGNYFMQTQVVDVNGDSIPDIEATLTNATGQANTYYGFTTLLGLGNGEFSSPVNTLEPPASTMPLAGNFFNDGAIDFVTNAAYSIGLFLNQGGSTMSLTSSAASLDFGSSLTLTATVTPSMTGRPAATGNVNFYDGTNLLGTAALNAGVATFSTSLLTTGTHSIKASYVGDTNFNPNSASAIAVSVSTLTPAFTLTGTPSTLSLSNGANGTVTLNFAANATFSGAVSLTCAGAPINASCGFNSSTVTLAPGGTASATLVVGTTATTASSRKSTAPWAPAAPLVSAAALLGLVLSRRRRRIFMGTLSLILLSVLGFTTIGCGSSGTSVKAVGKTSFTVTVTATPSGSSGTAQTTSVNVTVQ